MENFKSIITRRRKELKMTQKDLAEKINVSDKTISKWETGTSYPDITMLGVIAKALEINISELLGASDIQERVVQEEIKYDKDRIMAFKIQSVMACAFIILSAIIPLFIQFINNEVLIVLLLVFSGLSFFFGIILFILGMIMYRSFYINFYYKKEYDLVFFKYALVFFHILTVMLILISSLISYHFIMIIPFLVIIGASLIINLIRKKSNRTIKKDLVNRLLFVLSLVINIYMIIASTQNLFSVNYRSTNILFFPLCLAAYGLMAFTIHRSYYQEN